MLSNGWLGSGETVPHIFGTAAEAPKKAKFLVEGGWTKNPTSEFQLVFLLIVLLHTTHFGHSEAQSCHDAVACPEAAGIMCKDCS
jgi:hypothetical protein